MINLIYISTSILIFFSNISSSNSFKRIQMSQHIYAIIYTQFRRDRERERAYTELEFIYFRVQYLCVHHK
jgi:hypothetical protein